MPDPRRVACHPRRQLPIASSAVLAFVMLAPVRSTADVRLVEKTRDAAGSRVIEGVRTTSIKGARMRLDAVRNNQPTTTLYDVPAGATITLEAKKKRATWRDVDRRNAKLESEYPRARVSVAVTSTGATRTLVGASCREYTLSVRVPMTKDGSLALSMAGSAWIASDVPGAEDYDAFAAAAIERQIVLGPATDNKILLAITRARTELYRALGDLHGIPYVVETATNVDGKGMLAGVVRKLVSGSQTTEVTSVSTAPLADELFVVPAGWKSQKK
jgi:hypothetical protein